MAATPSGTRQYFEKLLAKGIQVPHGPLGATDLEVSRVGFGGYRVHEYDPDHREALRTALLSGCNLIDTSTNYTDGSSERLIGQVTAELIERGELKREELVIVTKVGYVQGENLKEAQARAARGQAYPEMVEFQPDCWHNISPQFIEAQITKSLERLKVTSIDVLLLHNPEYYLKNSDASRDMYYKRIEEAFKHLETERSKGRIKYYGVSSNTFGESEARSDFTNLARVIEIAKQVAKPSHFAVIQFPFNVFESGAALSKNNRLKDGPAESVFEIASRAKLGVLVNRPFNAFQKGRLVRLTSFPKHDEVEVKGGLHVTLGRAIELEKTAPGYPKAPQGLQWAHVLRDKLSDLDDLLAWREALYQQIFPSIRSSLSRLSSERQAWSQDYQNTIQELLKLITWDLENLAEQKSKLLDQQLVAQTPELVSSPTLSRKVLRIYWAYPQVSTVLIGMRTPRYVKYALQAEAPLELPKANEALSRFLRYRS
jgi:aryl-alcohol dehydrogenase-like predicted oxidoreductase